MQLRCTYCQTMFALSRDEMLAALEHMEEEKLRYYDAHCPKCRRANRVDQFKLQMAYPSWKADLKAIAKQSAEPPAPALKPALPSKATVPQKAVALKKATTHKKAAAPKKAAASQSKKGKTAMSPVTKTPSPSPLKKTPSPDKSKTKPTPSSIKKTPSPSPLKKTPSPNDKKKK